MQYLITNFPDMIGVLGVILTLIAYYYLNLGKWAPDSLKYLLLNLFGSCFLMFSLFFSWNLASAFIEIAWILISLLGLYRYLKIPMSDQIRSLDETNASSSELR